MKYASKERLAHLEEIKDAKHASLLAVSDRANEYRSRRNRLQNRIKHIQAEYSTSRGAQDDIKKIEQEIADLDVESSAVQAQYERLTAEFQAQARLYTDCLAFARANHLPVPMSAGQPETTVVAGASLGAGQ